MTSGGDFTGANFWVCCPLKYAAQGNTADSQPIAMSSTNGPSTGIWVLVSVDGDGPSRVDRSGGGRLFLRVRDPVTKELRWAEHKNAGFPLRIHVDESAVGQDAVYGSGNEIPSTGGYDFPPIDSSTAQVLEADSTPYGAPFPAPDDAPQVYVVDLTTGGSQSNSTGQTISPGTWRTNGSTDSTSLYRHQGYWKRLNDPSTAGGQITPVIAQSSSYDAAVVTILPTDWGFSTYGYQEWTKDVDSWFDGDYLVPDEIAPGTYTTVGAAVGSSGSAPATWTRYDGTMNVLETKTTTGSSSVTIQPTDYRFQTRGFAPWHLQPLASTTPANVIDWRQLLNMEYRSFIGISPSNLVWLDFDGIRLWGIGRAIGAAGAFYQTGLTATSALTGYFPVDLSGVLDYLRTWAPNELSKARSLAIGFTPSGWSQDGDGLATIYDMSGSVGVTTMPWWGGAAGGSYVHGAGEVPAANPYIGIPIVVMSDFFDFSLVYPSGSFVASLGLSAWRNMVGRAGGIGLYEGPWFRQELPISILYSGGVKVYGAFFEETVDSAIGSLSPGMSFDVSIAISY